MTYILNLLLTFNNIINKIINYFFPYKSILYLSLNEQTIVNNITISFYIKWYLSFLFSNNYSNKGLFRIYIREYDKYIIYNGISDEIFNTSFIKNLFNTNNNEINKPRNLLVKYNIFINDNELLTDDKNHYKKYDLNSKIEDIIKFNGIKINNITILKNNIEFKTYIEDIELIHLKDIYHYL
jgi:hypothetical protein